MIYPSKTHHFWRISLLFAPVLVDCWRIFSISSHWLSFPGLVAASKAAAWKLMQSSGEGSVLNQKTPWNFSGNSWRCEAQRSGSSSKNVSQKILDDIGYSWMVTFKQQDWGLQMMNASQICRPWVMTFPSWTIGSQWTLLIHPRDGTFLLGTGIVGGILPVPHSCVFNAVSCGRRNEGT